MSNHRISKLLFAVVISAAFGATAFGQTAQVTGRINDQGGAVIQSARVTVTNEGNGFKRETTSNDEGYFTVPSLLPGTYQVSVQKDGFKPVLQTGLVLQVEQVARLNYTLQTGTVSETVEVQSGAVALDSESASIGQIVTRRQVNDLPLNGRNFLQLLFIGAGAVETAGEAGAALAALLELDEHTVEHVADGRAAFAAIDRQQPDLIILDVQLPGMDGYAICERLKHNPETWQIPIIMVTVDSQRDARLQNTQV